jgi:hypothetical protein
MSAECTTDGYGIYLIHETGNELIGVREDEDKLSYSVQKGTKKICARAFARMKHLEVLELPSSLESIEEDAFCNGPRDLQIINHSRYLDYQDGFLILPATGTLLLYTGNAAEIILPDNVSIIGKGAFRSCVTETIVLGDAIKEIHEDAFTTCRMECVSFTRWHAYVYFPKKDIRLRQHMLDGFGNHGIFDFERYDTDLLAGFMEDERMRMIAARLKWPYHLSKENEERFHAILEKDIEAVCRCTGAAQDTFTLKLLLETHVIHPDNIERCLSALHELDDLEAYAFVDDYQNSHQIHKEFDYDI